MRPDEHFVYLYRDRRNIVRYVGYGRSHVRAASHQSGSHSAAVDKLIAIGGYTLEIAGPFGSAESGRMVESALISSIKPDLNRSPGETRWRFRPFGVPAMFAARLDAPELELADMLSIAPDRTAPMMFVKINDENFDDGRRGYDPTRIPTDKELRE